MSEVAPGPSPQGQTIGNPHASPFQGVILAKCSWRTDDNVGVLKIATPIGSLTLIASLWITSLGCQGLFESDAADAKWRADYARCRFGTTPEQLESLNESPDAERPRQKPGWEACLTDAGWQIRPRSSFGPKWDD